MNWYPDGLKRRWRDSMPDPRRLTRTITTLAAVACVCFGSTFAIAADPAAGMPVKPDTSPLKANYPICSFEQKLSTLEKCLTELEAYRSDTIETYNNDVKDYIENLTNLDNANRELEKQNKLTSDDYNMKKSAISVELVDASTKNGFYMRLYYQRMSDYKRDSRSIRGEIAHCLVTLSCSSS